MFKTLKKIVTGAALTTAAASAAYVTASKVAFETIFNPTNEKEFIDAGWLDDKTRETIKKQNEEDLKWYESQSRQEFTVKSFDGVNIASEVIFATKQQKFVIIAHPYNSNRFQTIRACREFAEKGFNVVWYDQRHCGKSASAYCSMGWYEHFDLIRITDMIAERYKGSKIILYGISMGGACVYKAMAEGLSENVKIAIVEAGFTSMIEVLKKQIEKKSNISIPGIINGVNYFVSEKLGFDMMDFDCLEELNNSKCPLMIIHSKDDSMVEYNDSLTAYISYNGPKKLLAYENGCHGALSYRENYFENIFEFIDKYQ